MRDVNVTSVILLENKKDLGLGQEFDERYVLAARLLAHNEVYEGIIDFGKVLQKLDQLGIAPGDGAKLDKKGFIALKKRIQETDLSSKEKQAAGQIVSYRRHYTPSVYPTQRDGTRLRLRPVERFALFFFNKQSEEFEIPEQYRDGYVSFWSDGQHLSGPRNSSAKNKEFFSWRRGLFLEALRVSKSPVMHTSVTVGDIEYNDGTSWIAQDDWDTNVLESDTRLVADVGKSSNLIGDYSVFPEVGKAPKWLEELDSIYFSSVGGHTKEKPVKLKI